MCHGVPVSDHQREVAGHGIVGVRRSARRRTTVAAFREGGRIVVAIPGSFTSAEEDLWVERMVERISAAEQRRRPSDADLTKRAQDLAHRYLGARVRPTSVSWASNQGSRWGSCSPLAATIRVSDRLVGMPEWVLDYVLVHELAHLVVAGHGPEFWELVDAYPHAARARGFLDGVTHVRQNG